MDTNKSCHCLRTWSHTNQCPFRHSAPTLLLPYSRSTLLTQGEVGQVSVTPRNPKLKVHESSFRRKRQHVPFPLLPLLSLLPLESPRNLKWSKNLFSWEISRNADSNAASAKVEICPVSTLHPEGCVWLLEEGNPASSAVTTGLKIAFQRLNCLVLSQGSAGTVGSWQSGQMSTAPAAWVSKHFW